MDMALVEDAIAAALRADETIAGYLREAFILPTMDLDELEKLTNPTPAFGVMYLGGEYRQSMGTVTDEVAGLAVVALNRNLRGNASAAHGGAAGEIGCWGMMKDARRVLDRNRLGLENVHDILAVRSELLFSTSKSAGTVLELKVTVRHTE